MGENKVKRKGRTAAFTIDEMLDSQRFRIAYNYFDVDKSFMRAMLIELLWECTNVVKSTVIKKYATHSSLDQFEMIPLLRSVSEFDTYNIWWGMSELEKQLYVEDPKHKLNPEEREELLNKLKTKLMGESA